MVGKCQKAHAAIKLVVKHVKFKQSRDKQVAPLGRAGRLYVSDR